MPSSPHVEEYSRFDETLAGAVLLAAINILI
jgi:hypothetical protein